MRVPPFMLGILGGVLGSALCSGVIIFAWSGPGAGVTPPDGNVSAPVNVGTSAQIKNGALGVNSLAVYGNTLLGGSAGSNAYLNFGATAGGTGYGFRDNNGTMEYRDAAASGWSSFTGLVSAGGSGAVSDWTGLGSATNFATIAAEVRGTSLADCSGGTGTYYCASSQIVSCPEGKALAFYGLISANGFSKDGNYDYHYCTLVSGGLRATLTQPPSAVGNTNAVTRCLGLCILN